MPHVRYTRSPDQDVRDAAWWARVREGDARALGALVEAYAAELRDVAGYTVHAPDLSEDVVQDVFVRLWQRRETIHIAGSVIAYLYRMTHNAALNAARHERAVDRAHAAAHRESELGSSSASNAGPWQIADGEASAALHRALDTLQPQVRTIFLMARLHGMRYAEIAETLGIAVATVHSQMSRAVRKLAEAMNAEDR